MRQGMLLAGGLGLGALLGLAAMASSTAPPTHAPTPRGPPAGAAALPPHPARGALRPPAGGPLIPRQEWQRVCLEKTSEHEGTYWSVNRNLDGAGVSWGILQWTQAGGGLAEVVDEVLRAVPGAFERAFGVTSAAVLSTLRAHSLAKVAWPGGTAADGRHYESGAYPLWNGPFLAAWRSLGRLEAVQEVQRRTAADGPYMRSAVAIAEAFGIRTERAMVLYFNRTVHMGPSGAIGPANRLIDWYAAEAGRKPASVLQILAQYGWQCAAKFRRTSPPPEGSRLAWTRIATGTERELELLADGGVRLVEKPVVGEVWHVVPGGEPAFDLWNLILRRTAEILTDDALRDQDVEL